MIVVVRFLEENKKMAVESGRTEEQWITRERELLERIEKLEADNNIAALQNDSKYLTLTDSLLVSRNFRL